MVVAGIEAGGWLAYWLGTGERFSWSGAQAARLRVLEPGAVGADPTAAAQAAARQGVVLHPYLGYVDDAAAGDVYGHAISRFGFIDDAPPLRQARPDRYVVGLVGGSVALQLGLYGTEALAAALQRSPALAGKQVDIVRLAVGGWKQPQQLFVVQLLSMLGGHFDCIVNLDGFNEVTLVEENVPFGVPAWFPRSWARLADAAPTGPQLLAVGRLAVLRDERRTAAAAAGAWWWSPTAQFLWWWRDQDRQAKLRALQVEIEHAPAASFAATGPGTGGATVESSRTEVVALWRRCSQALHAFCRERGITYCHFLQPNQYVAGQKTIGAAEAKVALAPTSAWARGVAAGYPLLQAELANLRAAGVPCVDLTPIFLLHEEPLYVDDCCHLGPRGNAILAEHVAAGVRRALERPAGELASLAVGSSPVVVGPLQPTVLQVLGVGAAGQRFDVTGVGYGTRVYVEPADHFVVGVDGCLRALQRGQGTVRVEHAGLRVTVPVTADWPDLVVGADARPDAAGHSPRLAVERKAAALSVRCDGLPEAAMRVLVVGPRPLPTVPLGAELDGLQLVPLPATGGIAPVEVPLPVLAGRPLFLRAYALAADAKTLLAASATVAVTRD